jgi:hypothetical protein
MASRLFWSAAARRRFYTRKPRQQTAIPARPQAQQNLRVLSPFFSPRFLTPPTPELEGAHPSRSLRRVGSYALTPQFLLSSLLVVSSLRTL